jgi:hypothetical protein
MLVGWLVALGIWWSQAYRPYPPAEHAAMLRLERCARGYLGTRLYRAQRIVWKELPDSAVEIRARTALPDTIYLHPAWASDEWTLAHEMLHVAIGRPGHPVIPFQTCGLLRPE